MAHTGSHRVKLRPGAPPQVTSLTEIIDEVIAVAGSDRVSLRDVIRAVGDASFAPILLLPALSVATPLSGIPLFSTLMGVVIFLISIQMLMRKEHLWLPRWMLRCTVKGAIVRRAFGYLYPVGNWVDAKTDRRFRVLVQRPLIFIPQMLCAISGAMMMLLEFIPFSSSIMGLAVALLALGMMTRDGIVLLVGFVPYGLVIWLIITAAT